MKKLSPLLLAALLALSASLLPGCASPVGAGGSSASPAAGGSSVEVFGTVDTGVSSYRTSPGK